MASSNTEVRYVTLTRDQDDSLAYWTADAGEGAMSEGKTVGEALRNVAEAVDLVEDKEDGE